MYDNDYDISPEEFLETEYKHLVEHKTILGNYICKFFNTNSLNRIMSKLGQSLYLGRAGLPFRLNPSTGLWRFSYISDRKRSPHHFEIIIHNGSSEDDIGKYNLRYYLVPNGQNEKGWTVYRLVDDAATYKTICDKYAAYNQTDLSASPYQTALHTCTQFVDDIVEKLRNTNYKDQNVFAYTVESILQENSSLGVGVLTDDMINTSISMKRFLNINFEAIMDKYINIDQASSTYINKFKLYVIRLVRSMYYNESLKNIRRSLLRQLREEGIESIVSNVEINNTINLGDFNTVINLINAGNLEYESIIKNYFQDIGIPKQLHEHLVQLLKLYYELNNPSERNEKYLVDFLKKNHLSRSRFATALCDMNPTNIESFWEDWTTHEKEKYGHRLPQDSIYRYRKNVYVRKSVYLKNRDRDSSDTYIKRESNVVYGQDLLEKMRAVMTIFNEHSEYTKLLDISLGDAKKNGFIFDFVTYKTGDDNDDVNGKRLSEFTAMFNRGFDDEVLYLTYE